MNGGACPTGYGAVAWQGSLMTQSSLAASFRLDVRLANDAAVFDVLLPDMFRKIRTAGSDRVETKIEELRLDLRGLHCRGEPSGELRDRFLRRLRGRSDAEPDFGLIILVARLRYCRHIGQRCNPRSRRRRKCAQLAGIQL